jgi:amidase
MTEITHLTAIQLSEAIHSRSVSCVEVMAAFLERINALNPDLNALVSLMTPEACLAIALESDRQLSSGNSAGWLHGIPIAIKDLFNAKGLVTAFGSPVFPNVDAQQDDPHVARIRAAGALIIAKTNVPAAGLGGHTRNTRFGLTRNGLDRSLSAGGSSGGAATAVSSYMLPLADGSDMMGSLRTPAAFQGIVGFRASAGAIPAATDADPQGLGLTSIGAMARNVSDVSALLTTLCSDPAAHRHSPHGHSGQLKGLRIGWLGDADGHWPMANGVLAQCQRALENVEGLGAQIDLCPLPFPVADLWLCWLTLRQHSMLSDRALYEDPRSRSRMSDNWRWEIEHGMQQNQSDLYTAETHRRDWLTSVETLFRQYDVLAAPAAQVFPFDAEAGAPTAIEGTSLETYHEWLAISLPASLAGLPVISLPVAAGSANNMTGIQLMMPRGRDDDLLAIAARAEQALLA